MTTPIAAAQFVSDFPEFADAGIFPPSSINFWAAVAAMLLNPARWMRTLPLAMELFIAHNIVLEAQAQQSADLGGIPGLNRGIIASEAGGSVNVSYDTAGALVPDAGHWNLTTYGTRLMWLVSMFGAGPIQVGAPFGCGVPFLGLDTAYLAQMLGSNMGATTNIQVGPGWRNWWGGGGLYE